MILTADAPPRRRDHHHHRARPPRFRCSPRRHCGWLRRGCYYCAPLRRYPIR